MVSNLRKYKKRKKLPAIIPKKIFVRKGKITDIKSIAENFNKYFAKIGLTLAKTVDSSTVTFDKYWEEYNITQSENDLTINELKDAFFSLKLDKSSNVIKKR